MATTKELEDRVAQLEAQLKQAGLSAPPKPASDADRADFIPFGSAKHLTFLGLVVVDDLEEAREAGQTVITSRKTGVSFRLADEMSAAMMMRPMDPDKAILLVLKGKIDSFESGAPKAPDDAPPLFAPGLLTGL